MADLEKTVSIIFAGVDNLSGTASQINRSFSDLGGSISSVADPLAGIAESVLKAEAALAALAVGGLVVAFNASKNFESSMIELKKVVGDQPEVLDAAKTKALELSAVYGESASDILGSMAEFKQAGFDMNDSMTLAATAMDMVIAGGVEASQASELLVASLKGFREPASEAGRLLDILNSISNAYATDVEQLGVGMAALSPIAYQMGFSMEETAGVLTPVIEIFRSGDEAAVALKTGLLKLIDDSAPVKNALESIGVSQFDLNGNMRSGKDILNDVAVAFQGLDQNQKLFVTQQLVGIQQSARMVEVFDNLSKSTDITAVAMGSAGSAAGEVAARLESSEVAVNRFISSFTNLSIAVGDSFREAAKEAINGGTDIETALEGLVRSGAFDPLLNMVAEFAEDTGTYLSGIAQALPEAMEGVDFSALIEQVRGLGTEIGEAFDLLFGSFDLTKPEELEAAIQKVVNVMTNLTATARNVIDGMSPLFSTIGIGVDKFSELGTGATELAGKILGTAETISKFVSALSYVGPAIGVLVSGQIITATANVLNLTGSLLGLGPLAIPAGIAAGITAIGYAGAYALHEVVQFVAGINDIPNEIDMKLTLESGDVIDLVTGYIRDTDGKIVGVPTTMTLENGDTIDTISGYITDADGKQVQVRSEVVLENGDTLDLINGLITSAESGQTYDLHAKITIDQTTDEWVKEAIQNGESQLLINYVVDPSTENLAAAMEELGAGFFDNTKAALDANVKGPIMETLEWIDAEGQRHELKVPVDNTDIAKTTAAIEAVPTEKMLEIKLQGDIDTELAQIKANAEIAQTSMEWTAKVNIAQAETAMQVFKASIDSVNTGIQSTGNTLTGLFDLLGDSPNSFKLSSAINAEMKYREQEFQLQKQLLEQEIELNKQKTDAAKNGESMISITAEGLEPELEAFMWKIIERVHIRATSEASEFLLGI
ncbi:MAG: phage tail tape measure protein [Bacilli bacterium]|jgi:TP901 family phage tail tape measure protein